VQNIDLRPLGAGEILDRAVTLYVRRFVAIATVLAIITVPLLLLQALVSPGSFRIGEDLLQVLQAGGNAAKSGNVLAKIARDSQFTLPVAGVLVGGLLVRLLAWNALVAVIAGAYAGVALSPGAAYAIAVRRYFPQFVVGLVFFGITLVALIPVGLVYVAIIAAVVALSLAKLQVVAIIAGIVLGLAFVAFAMVVTAWLLMAYELASVAVVTEGPSPVAAVASGLRRAFGRGTRWRTLVAGLVYVALVYGATIPAGMMGLLLGAVTHQPLLAAAASAVASVLVQGLLGAFVVVYATDVRVRREGLDLAALADLGATAAPAV
jgi:hypothetical protein